MWGNLGITGLVDAAISNVRKIGKELEEELNDAVGGDEGKASPSNEDAVPDPNAIVSSTRHPSPVLGTESPMGQIAKDMDVIYEVKDERKESPKEASGTHEIDEIDRQCLSQDDVVAIEAKLDIDPSDKSTEDVAESLEPPCVAVDAAPIDILRDIREASPPANDAPVGTADNDEIASLTNGKHDQKEEHEHAAQQESRTTRNSRAFSCSSIDSDELNLDDVTAEDIALDSSIDLDDSVLPEPCASTTEELSAVIDAARTPIHATTQSSREQTEELSAVIDAVRTPIHATTQSSREQTEELSAVIDAARTPIHATTQSSREQSHSNDVQNDAVRNMNSCFIKEELELKDEIRQLNASLARKEEICAQESQKHEETKQELNKLKVLFADKETLWKRESIELQRQYAAETERLRVALDEKDKAVETLSHNLRQLQALHEEQSLSYAKLKDDCEQMRIASQTTSTQQQKTSAAEVSKLKSLLAEKETQLEAYASEGQALARKQGEMEKTIRKSRQEVRDKEAELSKLTEANQKQQAMIDKLNDCIRQHEIDFSTVNKNIAILQTVNQASADKLVKLEGELSSKNAEIANLRKALDTALSDASKVIQDKQKLQEELDIASKRLGEGMNLANMSESQKRDLEQKEAVLRATNKHLQESLQRCMSEASSREESLKEDLKDMRKRWQEAVACREQLASDVGESTKPLLNQISNLQDALRQKEKHWHEMERNLSNKVRNAEELLATETKLRNQAEQASAKLKEQVHSLEVDIAACREKMAMLKSSLDEKIVYSEKLLQDLGTATTELRQEVSRSSGLEEQLRNRDAIHHAEVVQLRELSTQQLATIDQMKAEMEHLRALMGGARTTPNSSNKDNPSTRSSPVSHTDSNSHLLALGNDNSNMLLAGKSQQLLTRKNEEIIALRETISQLEKSRNELLLKYTILQEESVELQKVKEDAASLQNQNDALLLLLGEKEEEVEDLMSCMRDVKELYRQQIDSLILERESR